ncbi:MAG: hypothetical protein HN712_10075 [Gemmatimonadetes bacterium]|nr:hypothetical protein [Gemmatimonadota bacterium]
MSRLLILVLLLLMMPVMAPAQLLFRPGEPYVNYAYESYRAYDSILFGRDRTPQFDALGQFVMNGINVFELQEFRSVSPSSGSIIRKPGRYGSYLNRLVVADDSYKGVTTRFIIGDRIRAKFTPLTLDLAAMNGMRLDSHFRGGSLVLVTSRVDKPIFEALQNNDHRIHGSEASEFIPRWATYLMGADLRTQLQGLDAGVSWVNQFRTDSLRDLDENSFKGALPSLGVAPEWVVVRVADQSLDDAVGARVRGAVVYLNGQPYQPEIGPYDKNNPDRMTMTVTVDPDRAVIPPARRDNSNALVIEQPHQLPSPEGFYEAEGSRALLLWFKVPSTIPGQGILGEPVKRVDVELEVSGDYQLELSEVFNGASANPATYFYTAAQSQGRPALANFRRVRLRYGRQTGRTLLSAHVNLDVKGWLLHSEVVRNYSYRGYPGLDRHNIDPFGDQTHAWFVNARRDFGSFSLGGEAYNIDGEYSTVLNVQDDDLRSYFQFLSSPFSYPTNFNEPRLADVVGGDRAAPTNTIEFNTVDDNDDKDQYPDSYFLRRTTDLETGGRFIEDPDGVFPGLDADLNGRPDINENNNLVPDYYEPFLLYNVNPDAYDFGEDMNGNGVIDERENDELPDYPYNADRRGYHLFAELPVPGLPALKLTAGHHKASAPFQGGEARVSYVRSEFRQRYPFFGNIVGIHKIKRIEDDVPDPVFGFGRSAIYLEPDVLPPTGLSTEERLNPLGIQVLQEDPLLFRDSWVNRLFLQGRFTRVEDLNVELSSRYDRNRQLGAGEEDRNTISDWAFVLRSDYTWQPWRDLRVIPQLKWMTQRLSDDGGAVLEIDERFFYPILRVEYPVSNRTTIKAGAQGFPFLKSTYRNDVSPDVDFDEQVYLLQLNNTSNYVGYEVNVNLGYERRHRRFLDRQRADQDLDYNRLFLRVIAGLRPLF